MVSIYDCAMTPDMTERWRRYGSDTKATLAYAFHDGMLNPHKTASHKKRVLHIRGRLWDIHVFRIGYASFRLALTMDKPAILVDAILTDGKPLYASESAFFAHEIVRSLAAFNAI